MTKAAVVPSLSDFSLLFLSYVHTFFFSFSLSFFLSVLRFEFVLARRSFSNSNRFAAGEALASERPRLLETNRLGDGSESQDLRCQSEASNRSTTLREIAAERIRRTVLRNTETAAFVHDENRPQKFLPSAVFVSLRLFVARYDFATVLSILFVPLFMPRVTDSFSYAETSNL